MKLPIAVTPGPSSLLGLWGNSPWEDLCGWIRIKMEADNLVFC